MSDETRGIVSAAWITKLLEASFGGEPPRTVQDLVNPDLCAQRFAGSKLGVIFTVQGGEARPTVRVRSEAEPERLLDIVAARFPAAGALVRAIGHDDVLYETDGTSWRVLAMGVGGDELAGRVVDAQAEYAIVTCDAYPARQLPDALAAQTRAFADKVERGTWHVLQAGDRVHSLVYTSEGAWTPELDDQIAALGTTPGLEAALQVYADAGLRVQPWAIEFDGRTVRVCLWGAHLTRRAEDLPEIFGAGVPEASAFAAELALTLPERDQEAGRELVAGSLFPTLMALGDGADPADHAATAWRFLLDVLAFEAPFDRLEALRRVHAENRLALAQRQAFQLAVARYVATHDVDVPAELPSDLAGLDVGTVKERAQALLAEVDGLLELEGGSEEPENRRLPGVGYEPGTIRDLLERATGGDFAAAEGALHDFLVKLGPTGYDDDPSLIGLEDIDLDPADRDAAIEEALAEGDDDLG